jgi:5-methylcytosine-specific restriction endonuclease McrA
MGYDRSNTTTGFTTCFLCGASILPGESETGDVCLDCCAKERDRVNDNLRRAELAGAPATLTLGAWLQTLRDFGGRCAYCEENVFTELEHFVPLRDGGGTTPDNCVPACRVCNRGKGTDNPGIQPGLPGFGDERRERVRRYLAGRRE